MEIEKAKKAKKKIVRREYTKAEVKEFRAHSKARTPVSKLIEVDEAIGRFIEAEGINTGNRSRTSTIKLKRSRYTKRPGPAVSWALFVMRPSIAAHHPSRSPGRNNDC